ncbi:MAG: NEW3 domain-containing protein, partial [Acidimicrobiales bacterium]
ADNTFNSVTYGAVTTTKLRVVLQSGAASVGVIQWVVDSVGEATMSMQTASTVPGMHTQPTLISGQQTTSSATFTNTGKAAVSDVDLTMHVPSGWAMTATASTTFSSVAPGQTETTTWDVTPPVTASGASELVVDATYSSPQDPSGKISADQWVTSQEPLPLPPGSTDLALTATASASYASPWTTVAAINNGIYPVQSSDDNDLTPYWGTWPETGTQWIELDWAQPVTTDGSSVYFADDGGGLQLPASWQVQYWDGSAFVAVPGPSAYPIADNTFNSVTYGAVTTTKLRVVLQSGAASVGVIQWVVDSAPGGS